MSDSDAARALFDRALDRLAGERESFVRAEGGVDESLIAEVLALLEHAGEGTTLTGPLRDRRVVESPGHPGESCETPETMPKSIGTFEIIRPLGMGGMGRVFLGRDQMLSRMVAVKMLDVLPSGQGGELVAGLKEGTTAVIGAKHPGLIETYGADVHEGVPYLVMEYVPGRTLAERIKQDGAFSVREALGVAIEIADATGALHRMGVVHRDIKPANVMFDRDGRTRVMDYGLAGAGVAPGESDSISGTPQYMAPEMFEGTSSPRSDVYAIGIVLFEMLAGTAPYKGCLGEITALHESGDLPFERIDGCPDSVRDVIDRATRPDVLFRTKDADRLHAVLEQALEEIDLVHESSVRKSRGSTPDAKGTPVTLEKTRTRVTRVRADLVSSTALKPLESNRGGEITGPEVICANCKYELMGLPSSTDCPECGVPVGFTTDPRLRQLKEDALSLQLRFRTLLAYLFMGMWVISTTLAGIVAFAAQSRLEDRTQLVLAIVWRAVMVLVLLPIVFRSLMRGKSRLSRRFVVFRRDRCGRLGPMVLGLGLVAPIDLIMLGLAESFEFSTVLVVILTSPGLWLYILMPLALMRVASGLGLDRVRLAARNAVIVASATLVFVLISVAISYFGIGSLEIDELNPATARRVVVERRTTPIRFGFAVQASVLIGIAGALGLVAARAVAWTRSVVLGVVSLTTLGIFVVAPIVISLGFSWTAYEPQVAIMGFLSSVWIATTFLVLLVVFEINRLSPYERAQRLSPGNIAGIRLDPINPAPPPPRSPEDLAEGAEK